MKHQLLLLDDVEGIGRSGDIVSVKPGFARNYLLPQKKAIIAESHLVRFREKLQKEREVKAEADKKAALAEAKRIENETLHIEVKVDAEGHMYGSVTAQDVAALCKEQLNLALEKRSVILPKGIKKIGEHTIDLRLKEGVEAKIALNISPKPAES